MPNNWKTYKLSEINSIQIIDGDRGKNYPSKNEFLENGYCLFLSAKNITKTGFEFSELSFISEEKDGLLRKGKLETNDIIITTRGTIGNVGYYKENFVYKNVRINSGMVVIRVDEAKISSSYVYQLFKSSIFQEQISSRTSGSAQPQLPIRDLSLIEINLPENLQEQQSIASILSAIDDKIENNLAINKTLEEMAMALYKHWFVDFGPFQDAEFVESELGMIPKGWEVKRLDDLINVVSKGTTPRMKDVVGLEIKIPFLKVKDVNTDGEINTNNIDLIPEEIHLKDLKRSILYENDLLFSIAGTIGRVSIVTKHLDNSNCNQALAFIRLKDKEKFKSFIYYWLKSDEIQNRIQNSVVQGVQANISLTVLKDLKIPISSDYGIIEKYSEKVNPILELILQNQEENRLLRTQRDTLLPQLISGAVRLKEFRE